METKPFSMQSPEAIAKDYDGNKQKIAQAIQMGIVDPTAGTLAGMFIDRMRASQMQEQGPPQTVAQQVFAPPQPPMPQGAPPPGAGAPPMGGMPPRPPAAPPPAPSMGGMPPAPPMGGMPPAPPMGPPPGAGAPPMGLAGGGLAALPIPDAMFDEPTNGGFANGGIVAFNGGGPAEDDYGYDGGSYNLPKYAETINQPSGDGSPESIAAAVELAREAMRRTGRSAASDVASAASVIPGSGTYVAPSVPSSADMQAAFFAKSPDAATNNMAAAVAGARRFMPTVPTINPPAAQRSAGDENALKALSGGQRFVNPMAPKAPAAPTVKPAPTTMTGKTAEHKALVNQLGLDKPLVSKPKTKTDAAKPDAAAPKSDLDAISSTDIKANMNLYKALIGPQDDEATNAIKAHFKEVLSPAYQDKEKKKDMWMALAQIGFGMAGTQSPYFLQAVGQAGAAALPGIASANKERKAAYKEALKGLYEIEGLSNQKAREFAAAALDMTTAAAGRQLQRDTLTETVRNNAAQLGYNYARLNQEGAIAREELVVRKEANRLESDKLTAWQEAQIRDKAVQRLQADPTFFVLKQRAAKDPQAAIKLQQLYRDYGVPYGGESGTNGPTPRNRPPLGSFDG